MTLEEKISKYLGWPLDEVREKSLRCSRTYKKYTIPKKSSGRRTIYQPSKSTKALQYALIDLVLTKKRIHSAAAAYRLGQKSPIRKHAAIHAKYSNTVRVDIANFFPSISPNHLFSAINDRDSKESDTQRIEDKSIITRIAFITSPSMPAPHLTIGAPISPIISNIIMFNADQRLCNFSKVYSGAYSRYADDFFFSSNDINACKLFLKEVKSVLGDYDPPFSINIEKTKTMTRGTRRHVTGLTLTSEGLAVIPRSKKRYIRKLIHDLKQHQLTEKELAYLKGYLAYSLDVEPNFCNALIQKYGSALVDSIFSYNDN